MAQKRSSGSEKSKNRISTELVVALIGLAGTLVVAFFGFLNTRTQILLPASITQTFEAKQTRVSELFTPTPSATATLIALLNPLRIEFIYRYSGDTLYAFLPPGILPNQVEPDKLDYMSLPMYNNVTFSVTNTSDQTIILSNELPVKLIDYQPHPDNVNILVEGGGGGASFRNFVVDIPINVGLVKAVFDEVPGTGQTVEDIRTEEPIDYFTLTPGEVEVFSLEVRFEGAGSFIFQPGVEYYRDGNIIQVWTPETISALVPQNITVWDMPSSTDETEFIYRESCTFAYPRDASSNFDKVYECNK